MACAPPPNTALLISLACDAEWKVQIMALFKMAHVYIKDVESTF